MKRTPANSTTASSNTCTFEPSHAEVRGALVDLIGTLRWSRGRSFLLRMCQDASPWLRRSARLALDRLEPGSFACASAHVGERQLPALPATRPVTIQLVTDVSTVRLHLQPTYAPIAVQRIVDLVRAGFYDGQRIHRVVPGFVAQFGDPGGDGYGGAPIGVRSETAPVGFDTLDVGLAEAGRDTGSSQIFVMLSPASHLRGLYPWLGRAEGDVMAWTQGDVIQRATVLDEGCPAHADVPGSFCSKSQDGGVLHAAERSSQ